MDAATLSQQTVIVEWGEQRLTFRNSKNELVRVSFPTKHKGPRNFRIVCAIAIAQDLSITQDGTSIWQGLDQAAYERLNQSLKWGTTFKSFVTDWFYFRRGQTNKGRKKTTITIDGQEPDAKGEIAEELFQAIPTGGFVLGGYKDLTDGRYQYCTITFVGHEGEPAHATLRSAVEALLASRKTVARPEAPDEWDKVIRQFERRECASLDLLGAAAPLATAYQPAVGLRPLSHLAARRFTDSARASEHAQDPESVRALSVAELDEHMWARHRIISEPVDLNRIFSAWRAVAPQSRYEIPHLTVLGPPGSGKSALLQYLAWQAAGSGLKPPDGQPWLPARLRLASWWHRAPHAELEEYLFRRYRSVCAAARVAQWRDWLSDGHVLLLMDGLDETSLDESFAELVRRGLHAAEKCPVVLTCRTTDDRKLSLACPDFEVFALPELTPKQRQRFTTGFPPEHDFDREGLLNQMERVSAILS
jgi:hypothetical protein